MRDANTAGEFSDHQFWDTAVIPTFAKYYLDAYAAWKSGDTQDVDVAWRIAFRTEPERLNCTQMIWLGINGHVNNDLAFMIEQVGSWLRLRRPQARGCRAGPHPAVVYPEIQRVLCPGLFSETVPPGADLDIFAWRELAWKTPSSSRRRPARRRARWSPIRSASMPRTRPARSSVGPVAVGWREGNDVGAADR